MIDQLEERGFVERESSQRDRRVVRLRLTPAGRKKSLESVPIIVDLQAILFFADPKLMRDRRSIIVKKQRHVEDHD